MCRHCSQSITKITRPNFSDSAVNAKPEINYESTAAFTPGQHVARQHVACCPSVAGYKGIHVADRYRQHVARPRNMLPGNMLPWRKRGLRQAVHLLQVWNSEKTFYYTVLDMRR